MADPSSSSVVKSDPSVVASTSTPSFEGLGVRKRVDSTADESFDSMISITRSSTKRLRVSAMAIPSSYGRPNSIGVGADRLPRPMSLLDNFNQISNSADIFYTPMRNDRPLSGSSFTAGSRAGSPFLNGDQSLSLSIASSSAPRTYASLGLIRCASSSSLRASPSPPVYADNSAKYHMRTTRITLDYTPPITSLSEHNPRLLGCSANNVAFFARGNRVHYKNLTNSDDVGQLFKLKATHGDLRCLEFNRKSEPEVMAIGTTKCIQLWDVQMKKMTVCWSTTKEITAMAWNGHTLTIGNSRGVIRNYDTRIVSSKMREQCKLTRHEASITTLDWSVDGKFLASGDASGIVYCWARGLGPPLQVGEVVQRRKKILQSGKITAVSWCPWQPKVLATGDARGILRLWNVNEHQSSSNALSKLDTGSVITGVHFSPHCREILTTHGPKLGIHPPIDLSNPRPCVENALAVHSFPSMGHVFSFRLPIDKPIGDSVLDGSGTKILYTTPFTAKINVCDVWAKRKEIKPREIKKSTSMLSIGSAGSSYSLIR